jgi:2-methylisocitrate lyase-like PEP mutase family enzyme
MNAPREVSAAQKLRRLLARPGLLTMPCCFDGLSARLVERAGFELTFMSGFAVSAARLGAPDAGLISYGEMLDQAKNICAATSLPVLGDGDTGYGNAINVKRTVRGYAQVGLASIMIEDQVAPKRCGHTRGKQVVDRPEALTRVRAAVDARDEGADILVLARTDALATHGMSEALWRAQAFVDLGADIVFVEAPTSFDELRTIGRAVRAPLLANMLEEGITPVLAPSQIEELGYKLVAYPTTLLSAAARAIDEALVALREGRTVPGLLGFEALKTVVGFDEYDAEEARYGETSRDRRS